MRWRPGAEANKALRTVGLLIALVVWLLAASVSSQAQQPKRVPKIGFLVPSPLSTDAIFVESFRDGLRELGYREGQSIDIELRTAEGKPERLPALTAELARLKVDIIVTSGQPAIRAAMEATSTIPIVMAISGDAVGTGLVASLARPGGNLTGLSILAPELTGKRLQLLKETVPRISRVAVLWNPTNPDSQLNWKAAQTAGQVLGLALQSLEVRDPSGFEAAFATMKREHADGLYVLGDPLTVGNRVRIVELAVKQRMPGIYFWRQFVDAGGLMSYGPSFGDMFRRAATYVDKILKGAKPADLPVEQPTRFELVINLKTAKALRLTIPQSILVRADQVIQ
jgi:putative ABC transport system substrate-binding protein